jgi:hypothetical protein
VAKRPPRVGARLTEIQEQPGTLVVHQWLAGRYGKPQEYDPRKERHARVTAGEALKALRATKTQRILMSTFGLNEEYPTNGLLNWKNDILIGKKTKLERDLAHAEKRIKQYQAALEKRYREVYRIPAGAKLHRSYAQELLAQTRKREWREMELIANRYSKLDWTRVQAMSFADAPPGWKKKKR